MVDRPDARAASEGTPSPAADRRRRVALRRLVDEMLDEIRSAANEDNWTAVSRSQAEMDLARIMTQVRREAVKRPGSANSGRSSRPSKRSATSNAKRGATRGAAASAKRGAKRAAKARPKQKAERASRTSGKRSAKAKSASRKPSTRR